MFYATYMCIYHSMLRIDVEIYTPAPDDTDGSITEVKRLRPYILCSLALWIFCRNACSAARRRLDAGSNCTNKTLVCNVKCKYVSNKVHNYSFICYLRISTAHPYVLNVYKQRPKICVHIGIFYLSVWICIYVYFILWTYVQTTMQVSQNVFNFHSKTITLRIKDLGPDFEKILGKTYTKRTINVIRKMQFLQNNVTFLHKIVCIYIGRA